MIRVRFVASSGSKIVGSRLRWEVPVSRAPKSNAAATVPPAVLRPSSATAMPKKARPEFAATEMSLVAMWNSQPRRSSEPANPANAPHTAITRM
jgi:hypothetical protein